MRSNASAPPGPTADTIRRYVGALPVIQESQPLDERAAQAARSVLERADPEWGRRLKAQVDAIVREVVAHLDIDATSGRYAITDVELRGIVARAVSRTGGQIAMDIGQALSDAPLAAQFAVSEQAGDPPDEDSPEAGRQTELQAEF